MNQIVMDGTTALETFSIIFPATLLVSILCFLCPDFPVHHKTLKYHLQQFMLEFILIIVPTTLFMTVFAEHIIEITISLVVISTLLYFFKIFQAGEQTVKTKQKIDRTKKFFVTNARSTVNVLSIIAILAVDFTVFPKRFAKTEMYGYSLMDVGVGLYVFANGIVAPEIRGHKSSLPEIMRSTLPLLFLGGFRFFITREIEYYVPVQEYGIHWNFFITLAVTKILSFTILHFIPVNLSLFCAILLLLAHESGLQLGLAQFVFGDVVRDNIFSANREGIVSVLGYVGLYFLAVAYGYVLDIKQNDTVKFKLKFLIKSFGISLIFLWATFILHKNFGVSRRLANAGYCAWIAFIGSFMVNSFVVVELIQNYVCKSNKIVNGLYSPTIFDAINYNGLLFFLLANVLTGLINIFINTENVSTENSLIIINLYMFVTCYTIYLLYIRNIKLKF